MSDLRTELFTKVLPKMNQLIKPQTLDNLTFDDGPEGPEVIVQDSKVSINQRIWDYLFANPKSTSQKVMSSLVLDHNDTSTRLSQMRSRGWLVADKSQGIPFLYSTDPQYTAYPAMSTKASLGKAHATIHAAKSKKKKVKPARVPVETKKSKPTHTFDLSTMSVLEARALYEELKKLFGG